MDILRIETVQWLTEHGETPEVRESAREELAVRRAKYVINGMEP